MRASPPRRSIAIALITVALGGTGCGAGSGFERDDLDAIVLTPVDAPDGTTYSTSVSGFQDLVGFARSAQEQLALEDDGFIAGHLALFAPVGAAAPGEGPELPADAPFAQGITGLFEGPDGASSALRRFVDDLKDRQLEGVTDLEPLGFGDESYAFEGDASGSDLVMYAWREDNLVLAVGGAGAIDPDVVRALAQLADRRAAGVSA